MFMLSLYDLDKVDVDRDFHCYLTDGQRFSLLGHRAVYGETFSSQRAKRSATGNAYGVPMLAAAVVPLMQQAVGTGILRTPKCPPLSHDELHGLVRAKRRRLCQDSSTTS